MFTKKINKKDSKKREEAVGEQLENKLNVLQGRSDRFGTKLMLNRDKPELELLVS